MMHRLSYFLSFCLLAFTASGEVPGIHLADKTLKVELIDSDAKEAIAFALLGYLALRGFAASVPSCTGARHEAVLGKICIGRFHSRHHGAGAGPQ